MRPREQLPLQQPGVGVRDRQAADAVRELGPGGHREDREAAVDPPRDHGAVGELPAESRRDGDAPLAVDRVSVLTGEHRSRALPDIGWRRMERSTGFRHRSPGTGPACGNFPTFHHFAPLPGILARRDGPSMGKSQRGRAGPPADPYRVGGGTRAHPPTRRRARSARPGRERRTFTVAVPRDGSAGSLVGRSGWRTRVEAERRETKPSVDGSDGRWSERRPFQDAPGRRGAHEPRERRLTGWAVASGSCRRRAGGRRSRTSGSSCRARSARPRSSGRCCTGCRPTGRCRSSTSAGPGTRPGA